MPTPINFGALYVAQRNSRRATTRLVAAYQEAETDEEREAILKAMSHVARIQIGTIVVCIAIPIVAVIWSYLAS